MWTSYFLSSALTLPGVVLLAAAGPPLLPGFRRAPGQSRLAAPSAFRSGASCRDGISSLAGALCSGESSGGHACLRQCSRSLRLPNVSRQIMCAAFNSVATPAEAIITKERSLKVRSPESFPIVKDSLAIESGLFCGGTPFICETLSGFSTYHQARNPVSVRLFGHVIRHVIRCRFVFSGKNDELTPDFCALVTSTEASNGEEVLNRVQPVWLQLSRDRKSLKWCENVQVRGIETGPVARSRRHYSPSGAEKRRSGDLS